MSGVSGDLYDFYQKEGRLTGLSLFDVSGHGIASGLITLLARSVILRVFMEAGTARLGEVRQKINSQLIEELAVSTTI
jgi:sigma-B regulation protein RsbU (phosphoserine phosphatase)